ncbi:uncharacterized protein LOC128212927 [Mya arenaria]|uniref:uncharacterized protein LOC128212927 n=1 Tax=Mya arenaria TaxID=6604 RepID=UPI0022E5EEFD|nr:uncharacterized protein LOC128212927 [Mya arenaria]
MRCWLDGLKSVRMKDQASLKDSYKNIIAEIRAIRREINNILDQVEKKTVNELDSLMNDFEKSVRDDLNTCAEMHDRLKTMNDKLQHVTGSQKETNSYIGFRKCQTRLNEARSLGQEIQRRPEEKFSFKSDKSVLPFLRNLNSLGNCYSVNSMPNKTDTVHVYKAQTSASYSVNINKDKRVCRIVGIYELPSGEVIIADLNNERVKLLDRQFNVTDHYDLPARAQHLCHIAGEEIAVAVSVHDLGEVQFLTVSRGHIQAGRKFTLDHKCNSIAHRQGQLYVVSSYSLYQYNMDGQMIRKMYDISPCNLPGQRCAVSSDGEIIYVINNAKHELVTLNKGGQVLSTLRDPVLQQPSGLCVSTSGHVFVCGQESDTVLQVDREGRQKLATIARNANGLNSPWSVCFSEQTSSLIVGSFFSNKISVVTLC